MLLSLGILILNQISQIILASFGLKGKNKAFIFFKSSFFFSLVLIFSYLFYLMRDQFFIWYSSAPSKFLIPPYNEIWYFFHYSFIHFFLNYFISFFTSLFFLVYFYFLNKRHQGKLFEREEIYIAALAIFLLPYPVCFIYIVSIFVIGLLGSVSVNFYFKKCQLLTNERRFPFYYIWLPLSILVFLVWKMI